MKRRFILAGLLAAITAPAAMAAAYPERPIRVLVAQSAGSSLDTISRIVTTRISEQLGQQLVIDNRGGAAGTIALEIGARAVPDGYTMIVGASSSMIVSRFTYKKLSFDAFKDFEAISLIANADGVMTVHPSVQAKTVKDLIALAKAQPGKLSYGSSGAGNAGHLAGELFNGMAGIKMVHIPYKGGAPAMVDLLAGQIQLIFSSAPTAVPQVKNNKIRGLAVTTSKRSVVLPELPTISEAGLPGFEADNWYGVVTVAKTPRAIIDRLNAEIIKAITAPDVKKLLLTQGLEVRTSTPAEFQAYIKSEYEKWAKVIKTAGIVAN
jgi:tripartite-type tricarboxylate transporter receptor subunit TctC